jgi:hypothetical protein
MLRVDAKTTGLKFGLRSLMYFVTGTSFCLAFWSACDWKIYRPWEQPIGSQPWWLQAAMSGFIGCFVFVILVCTTRPFGKERICTGVVIFMVIVCGFFASSSPTKSYARTVHHQILTMTELEWRIAAKAYSPCPLIVAQYEMLATHKLIQETPTRETQLVSVENQKRYYLWLYGPKIRLPYETSWIPSPLR